MKSHIRPIRMDRLPEAISRELKAARLRRGWSQAEVGKQAGLPQTHISGIETGRIVPRFDTLLDLVRVLGMDLVLVPQYLVPAVNALVRDSHTGKAGERPLYAVDDDDDGDAS
ncbi:MAG: helix-turn-helix transcriptional regulator [Alphaproteobacteria bacterium]|nr:helix-turn-helix transcriptional regulator [Alphaproteobacteria bacterium]